MREAKDRVHKRLRKMWLDFNITPLELGNTRIWHSVGALVPGHAMGSGPSNDLEDTACYLISIDIRASSGSNNDGPCGLLDVTGCAGVA